ncbi:MAG: large-conductance mechanosensitive channel protein MscL [Proteobacteria bacterium]|nr:large-conductance mechanosensitive channel protein MscL [Pseudomonadota bacterium]
MSIMSEFKQFAMKGNVVDMAVGIIIGAAFGKIVTSLVSDVMMPPLGFIMSGLDFSHLAITLAPATPDHPAVTIAYGKFVQTVIDFTITAFAIFMLVKFINNLKRKQAAQAANEPPSKQEVLLTEIRDLLKKKK